MSLVEDAKAVRAVVAQGWTQGDLARDALGSPVHPPSPDAVCWCVVGATQQALGSGVGSSEFIESFLSFVMPNKQCGLGTWNDAPDQTQEKILAALDSFIESL